MVLHEPVTTRMALATVVLIGAIFVLSLGAGEASRVIASVRLAQAPWLVVAGVGAACLSGVAYALLGVAIRYTVQDTLSIPMTLVTVTLTGVIGLGVFSWARIGLAGMQATPAGAFWMMMLAGVFNAVAFLALTKSLQLIPLIYVNALNATQATMAAVAGVMMFAERSSSALWLGVAMTSAGLVMMQRRPAHRRGNAGRAPCRTTTPADDVLEQPATTG
jgi:drug/metabolite transporter (DMT)-like permease